MSDTSKKEPTTSEAMFFFAIVKHMKGKADIDWSAVAAEQGLKSAEVAKVRFGQVKRKLGISTPATDSPPSARTTPKKTTPKKSGTKKAVDANATPTKVTKAKGRTGTKGHGRVSVNKERIGVEDEDEGTVCGGSSPKQEAPEGFTGTHFKEELSNILRAREADEASGLFTDTEE